MKMEMRGSGRLAELELLRRHGVDDLADAAVRRRHHDAVAHRRDPLRIAEEIGAPERRKRRQPAERRPQPQQNEAAERKAADEGIALRVDRRELRADRVDDGHAALSSCSGSRRSQLFRHASFGGVRRRQEIQLRALLRQRRADCDWARRRPPRPRPGFRAPSAPRAGGSTCWHRGRRARAVRRACRARRSRPGRAPESRRRRRWSRAGAR